ncbi:oxidoreductase,short chain dehydrogenase, putative [Coccidioides posadasii C735 delta SOWgp]|uniref:Very-long-chain 3-oxoacyl-CoA reductase n=1 Tax=Coccidioides posadasii (strain C735) TaxID=222929 RepID=C5PJK8_COCP7|nr:oxidoreductase,short chain dehydrogenase, putative [Coccidioides posadasii C735 delta SOWgp]EER22907.1 oxidoreductase,short chain dehydrogenase, putative [Coccidioides posadasii C735 delta SOWgp]|eukprot:XP_003065052.1 oxidoreductase,short chain dehydrogenase, putative [Coccidioides posadasii C735 delta SOWgp]
MSHISFKGCSFLSHLDSFQFDISSCQTIAASLVFATGGLFLLSRGLSFLRALFSIFILPGKSLSSFGPKGSWALVTGASDGIGKEYALQIARKGYNIILVSRSASKLSAVASEITSANPNILTKTVSMDFSENNDEDYEKLKDIIKDLEISILINNVGLSHSIPVPFVQTPEKEMKDIIAINCLGTLRVTQLVAPGMMQRKRGLILTMGSFGGLLPTPLLATYSGSKAFLQHWSTALASELEPYNIHVQLVVSYLVTSAMSKVRKASMTIPNPKAFVRSTLNHLGRSGGLFSYSHTSVPYWTHGLMAWGITSFLGAMSKTVLGINKSMHESIRQRALRKAARESGKKAQ